MMLLSQVVSRRTICPALRAKVNEVMDWLNTQFYRDFGYGLIYPQLFPNHKRRSDEAQAGAIAWGQQGAKNWLQISTTTGSGRNTNISVAMNLPLPTISARLSCRLESWSAAISLPIPTSSVGLTT